MNEFIEKLIGRLEELANYNGNAYLDSADVFDEIKELEEEYKVQPNIIDDLKAFLKKKFEYNSEQAEIWRDGSDKDSYFRQQKDLYMDRANIYGEVMREVDRLSEEHKSGWIPCSERLPDIGERVFVWVYGRVCIGKRIDAKLFEEYDIFSLENGSNESTKRIDAWQPLPAPYQPKGE